MRWDFFDCPSWLHALLVSASLLLSFVFSFRDLSMSGGCFFLAPLLSYFARLVLK